MSCSLRPKWKISSSSCRLAFYSEGRRHPMMPAEGIWRIDRSLIHPIAWRNCLEIRNESRSGDCRAARRGRRVVYLPHLAPTTHPPEAFQLFSKQFRKGYSQKLDFGLTEF